MRIVFCLTLAALIAGAGGCASGKVDANQSGKVAKQRSATRASKAQEPLIVTPASVIAGRVMKVNRESHYVILSFPVGRMPALQQRMNLYRGGLKAGEVRIAGPQRDDKIVADLIAGTAAEGDEVRSQ